MRCRGYGLTIDTAFEIPGAVACAARDGSTDLVISKGDARLDGEGAIRGAYRRAGSRLALDVPAVGTFRMDGPDALVVAPDPAAGRGDVGALLVASALPMVLWARGGVVLHASGVAMRAGAGAIAIAGESGSGKSTLARLLVERGAALVGDDSLWLEPDDAGDTFARGLSGGWFVGEGSDDRRFEPLPRVQQAAGTRLAAIVVLSRAASPGLGRLDPVAAVQALLRHRHRPNIASLLGRDAQVLAHCVAIARRLPIHALGLIDGEPEAAVRAIVGL